MIDVGGMRLGAEVDDNLWVLVTELNCRCPDKNINDRHLLFKLVSEIGHQHQLSNDVYDILSGLTFGKNFCNSLSGIIPNNSFHAIVKQVLKSVIF